MGKVQYQVGWRGEPSSFRDAQRRGLIRTLGIVGVRLRPRRSRKGFRLKKRGAKDWSHWRDLRKTLGRLRDLLKRARPGDSYWVEPDKGERVLAIRAVKKIRVGESAPSVATADVARVYREVTARFRVFDVGICNCRRIDGSSSWSEHAWCDAWDIGGTVGELDKVAHYLEANKGRLNIENILWRGVPAHYPSHIHVDFRPSHSGYPPCA